MTKLPVFLIMAVILWRALVASSSVPPVPAPRVVPPNPTPRRHLLVWLLALPVCAGFVVAEPRALVTYIPGAIFLATVLMWQLTRYVLVPLGLVRAAYYAGLCAWSSAEDRKGTALLAASMALHRKGELDPEAAAWLDEKLQDQTTLRAGAIAAAGAVAAVRGDSDGARALFESVRTLDPRATTRAARHAAGEWLAADAASRGAWDEVNDLGADIHDAGRSAWLLATVAARLLGKPGAPGRARLVMTWLLSPRRLHTFAIVERALSVPDGASPPEDDLDLDDVSDAPAGPASSAASAADPMGRALAAHVRLLAAKKPTPADVVRVGRAFDAAFEDEALPAQIEERAALLGATRASGVLSRLRADVEDSLFQLLKAHRIALDDTMDDLGVVAGRAQKRLRDETLTVIEALSDAVRSRVRERRPLPLVDEWREWSALRIAYDRGVLLGGPELRYLAFTKVHNDVCALAVWLYNDRKEKPIANAMFRFLLAEATATGDTEGIALQTKNVDCGF